MVTATPDVVLSTLQYLQSLTTLPLKDKQELLLQGQQCLVVNGGVVPAIAAQFKRAGFSLETIRASDQGLLCVYTVVQGERVILWHDRTLTAFWSELWITTLIERWSWYGNKARQYVVNKLHVARNTK